MNQKPSLLTTPPAAKGAFLRSATIALGICLIIQSALFSGRLMADSLDIEPDTVEQVDAEVVEVEPTEVEPINVASIDDDPWEFIVTPYLWATFIDGTSTAGNDTSSVDVNASDILRGLNFAFMGQVTARKGRWGGLVNVIYANLGGSGSKALTNVSVNLSQTLIDFALFYRVGDWRDLDGEGWKPSSGFVDLYAGARYMSLKLDLDLRRPRRGLDGKIKSVVSRSGSGNKSWIDPIIGFRTRWNLTDQWNVGLQADIGGGANADLTWQAMALGGYRFDLFDKKDANFMFGYKALQEKYQDGQGNRKFAINTITHGPILGLGIKF